MYIIVDLQSTAAILRNAAEKRWYHCIAVYTPWNALLLSAPIVWMSVHVIKHGVLQLCPGDGHTRMSSTLPASHEYAFLSDILHLRCNSWWQSLEARFSPSWLLEFEACQHSASRQSSSQRAIHAAGYQKALQSLQNCCVRWCSLTILGGVSLPESQFERGKQYKATHTAQLKGVRAHICAGQKRP